MHQTNSSTSSSQGHELALGLRLYFHSSRQITKSKRLTLIVIERELTANTSTHYTSSGTDAGGLYDPLAASYNCRTVFARDERRGGEKTTGGGSSSDTVGSDTRGGGGGNAPNDNLVGAGCNTCSESMVCVGVLGNAGGSAVTSGDLPSSGAGETNEAVGAGETTGVMTLCPERG